MNTTTHTPDTLEVLRGLELFAAIATEQLKPLAEIARYVEFPAHVELFHENEVGQDVFVVIRGELSLYICAPGVGCRQLTVAGPGELVGWSPLVGRHRLSDTARTLVPTAAIAFRGADMLALCRKDPEFGFAFMSRVAQTLAERLSATRIQLLEMSGMHLPRVQIESD